MRSVAAKPRIVQLLLALLMAGVFAPWAGAQMPRGIDVSNWQGRIDWLQLARAHDQFAFAKASEGPALTDATYPLNRAGAQSIAMRVGAYHFARPAGGSAAALTASAVAQADLFTSAAQPRPGDLAPVLDLEKTGNLSPARLTAWTQTWLDEVLVRLGVKAIVYASPYFWKRALADTPVFAGGGYPLWVANWTRGPRPIVPAFAWGGLGWTFWQWTNCVKVPGIAHCVDGDRFNGRSLARATISRYSPGPPVASEPPAVVGTPQVGRMLAALPGRWGGGKPVSFTYQWQRCDPTGAGCLPIVAADRETYTPTALDVDHTLLVSVTALTSGGTASAASPPTTPVPAS